MGVIDELLAQCVVAIERAPFLRPGEEDALFAGETVEYGRRLCGFVCRSATRCGVCADVENEKRREIGRTDA